MNVQTVIDVINAKKLESGMTAQQIADQSGVPVSTVNRILRNATENPTLQNVMDIANAVGYTLFPEPVPVAEKTDQDNPYIAHIVAMYEERLREKNANFNRVTAEKNRWILSLALIIGILVTGIMLILIYDITHQDIGLFQREAYRTGWGVLDDIRMALKSLFI